MAGRLTLYVQLLSATHSAWSSLNPRKGSGILCAGWVSHAQSIISK
jgi:2-phosphoglycerate kinase